jgi:RNA polymerase sigma-70 factor (ECF subfamily)
MRDTMVGVECAGSWTAVGALTDERTGFDAALVDGLRSGDDWAYEALIQRFQTPVYNLVRRLLVDPADTADVVQEVFVKVFRAIGRFRGQSSLKTWVYRIAVNEAHNQRRWFGRWRSQEVGLDDEHAEGLTFEQVLPDHSPSPLEVSVDNQTRERIEAALAGLKPVFRDALVLREVEGMSYEDIAEVLEMPLGTVKSRIMRGREALRQSLCRDSKGGLK